MFDAWTEKGRKEKEAKVLAEIRARDADLGVPSSSTMQERLTKAAISRMWDVVDDCLQKGADVKGEVNVSKKWLDKNYFAPMRKLGGLGLYSERAVPLLCIAVMHKDVKAAQNLLAQGADPSDGYTGWDSRYFTPLMISVCGNNAEMAKLLCDNGADLSWDGPLRLAEQKGYNDIIKIIRAEESLRAQGLVRPKAVPTTAEEKIIKALIENLPPAAREKLLTEVNEKFAKPVPQEPIDAGLAQDVVVSKPLTLKKQS